MPFHVMSDDEVHAFLTSDPPRTAKIATTRKDGRPHVAPVWYALDDDGAFMFNTGSETVKGRTLLRDPRVSICVDDDRPPFSVVNLEGVAEIITDPAEVRRWAGVLGGRYMGADRTEEFARRNGVAGELLIRVVPEKTRGLADLAD